MAYSGKIKHYLVNYLLLQTATKRSILHNTGPTSIPIQKIILTLLKDRKRKRCWASVKISDTFLEMSRGKCHPT
jgi:hypothetical protein